MNDTSSITNTGISHKKRKTGKSCIFCRRSHLVCSGQTPCQRCIRRGISHLCTPNDESQITGTVTRNKVHYASKLPTSRKDNKHRTSNSEHSTSDTNGTSNTINSLLQQTPMFISQNVGSEFGSLNEFLGMLDDTLLTYDFYPSQNQLLGPQSELQTQSQTDDVVTPQVSTQTNIEPPVINSQSTAIQNGPLLPPSEELLSNNSNNIINKVEKLPVPSTNVIPIGTPTNRSNSISTAINKNSTDTINAKRTRDHFFLTAADPSFESAPEQRLRLVLEAKHQAGLLQPYDHQLSYKKFLNYLSEDEEALNDEESKNRIIKAINTVKPALQAITESLQPLELLLIEENFERLLMGYDRVFSSMAVPACLWRRTGQIFRANREFATLVGCSVDELRAGSRSIYQLLTLESNVNLWEKYAALSFDSSQKSILTHCNLKVWNSNVKKPCCVTYTIARDSYNMPICIIGNFIPVSDTN
ncbi:hypothetical protein TBLA_0J00370 [Henningerozyma blattae CBS 6284]|uniref:Zn(2)-C6 fungal-type domain-containing protein n=1 Tax=Henningerozyma blattae (strain ATCC 34711 / CBS 6284 / DSM 70876 / NBRC 10599 / NRRL Y-10934 / UCD 77-7) TaxID=1071380 RepID=I2H9I5_HENB6|nr:hypothetical protein TBLA_0J00370 [Tetrapisispora blattae CBS 6284]CCH63037.1 hypothetical protein TBLA_0J00370 [Tetrapisispora blattae CBS 6284]